MTKKRVFAGVAVAAAATAAALFGGPVASADVATTTSSNDEVTTNAKWCKYRVTAVKLSLRESPAGAVKGYLYKNQTFIGIFGENVDGYKYGHRSGSTVYGWVNASYLADADC